MKDVTRREFLEKTVAVVAGAGFFSSAASFAKAFPKSLGKTGSLTGSPSISVFSKHLQWLGYSEMAEFAAKTGFDGIDLTVRPLGHVLPENVAKDLPEAVRAVRSAGLQVKTITTAIKDVNNPLTHAILETASNLNIESYRMDWLHYNPAIPLKQNLEDFERILTGLSQLNEKYGIRGDCQNHSGNDGDGLYFGACLWDLARIIEKVNSPWLGCQFDIYHAQVESLNTWTTGLEYLSPFIGTIVVKDFKWAVKSGQRQVISVPVGKGITDFPAYFRMPIGNHPIIMHFEYPLGGAEYGERTISVSPEKLQKRMQNDLNQLKIYLSASQPI